MLPRSKHFVFDSREVVLADRLEVKFDKHAKLGSTWSHTVGPKKGLGHFKTLKPY